MTIDFWTVVGLVAAVLATAAGVPQMIKAWRTRSTGDLSLGTLLMAVMGCLLWLVYGLHLASLPLIAANSVGITVLSVTLYFKLRYR